jgi:hypothetical protein
MKTEHHPLLPVSITFDAEAHSYIDDSGQVYKSVTTLVKDSFQPFDATAQAAEMARRTGKLEMEILMDWDRKRDAAAKHGTAVHYYAECLLNGTTSPTPQNAEQGRAFRIVDKALVALAETHDLLPPEQIVFDPLYQVAGTIDLPAINKRTGALAIFDWKNCDGITADAYRKVGLVPISDVPDSRLHRYSLQLSIYAWILTDPEMSAYPSKGQPAEMLLIHIPPVGEEPVLRPCVDLRRQVGRLMKHRYDSMLPRGG